MRATRKVLSRTRNAVPRQWASLNQDWLRLELRCFLFDERTFGDETIAAWKTGLGCWMRVGIVALAVSFPTLLLMERLSK